MLLGFHVGFFMASSDTNFIKLCRDMFHHLRIDSVYYSANDSFFP